MAAAITILAAFVIVVAAAAIVWLLGTFFDRFAGVFLPLIVAAVAALVFKPYYEWLEARLPLRALAVAAVFLSAIVPLVAFGWFFGALVVGQVVDLAEQAPGWWKETSTKLEARWPQVVEWWQESPYREQIQSAVEENTGTIVDGAQAVVVRIFTAGVGLAQGVVALLGWIVLPVYFAYFMMADPPKSNRLHSMLPFLKAETRDDVVYLARQFVDIIVAFFRGQLIIAFLQGLIFAFGFWIVDLRYGFVIGLALGFLNIVPYLGNILGLGVAIPIALFQADGGLVRLALVLLVFFIGQSVEAYILTPKIMGDRTGLHPMAIIVALFFWGSAFSGILGMILAIPLTAFLVVFWRLAKEKYVQELV